MATLTSLIRWQRYEPDLGDNRQLEKPFYVEIAAGITRAQLDEVLAVNLNELVPEGTPEADIRKAQVQFLERRLAPFVRMGAESLYVNERHIRTLYDLLELQSELAGGPGALAEFPNTLRWINSPVGSVELSYQRLAAGVVDPKKGKTGG